MIESFVMFLVIAGISLAVVFVEPIRYQILRLIVWLVDRVYGEDKTDNEDSIFKPLHNMVGKEYYNASYGHCYPIESGRMHLVLFQKVYTRDELYRLARWIDVIQSDLKRDSLTNEGENHAL